MNIETNIVQRLLRIRDVMTRTGISRPQIYRMMTDGRFPRSVKLSERSVAWRESEVCEWINGRIRS